MTDPPRHANSNLGPPGAQLDDWISGRWQLMLLRGLLALALGATAFLWPRLTLITLAFAWGAYALLDGALWLGMAIGRRGIGLGYRLWIVIIGLGGILAGLFVLLIPQYAIPVLALYIGLWAFFVGVLQLIGAAFVRRKMVGEWRLMAAGLLGVLLGLQLIIRPETGAVLLAWLIGGYAVFIGIDFISLALRMRVERRHTMAERGHTVDARSSPHAT